MCREGQTILNTVGQHLLVEYHGCHTDILDDVARIESMMRGAAEAAGATIVTATFHRFAPRGVSGVVVIAESHLSIHTWPEHGYAAVDFYTCGECRPEDAHGLIRQALGAEHSEIMTIRRGLYPTEPAMRIATHYHEGRTAPEDRSSGGRAERVDHAAQPGQGLDAARAVPE